MKYYKTGEFAKMANVSIRTIRYYDHINLLKPSRIEDNGYRLYSEKDFVKLQKILSLKYLGFSLEDIMAMTINETYISLQESFSLQEKMIDKKIDNLLEVKKSLGKTKEYILDHKDIDWQTVLENIHFASMENDLIQQYKDSTNIDIRIRLHEKYSVNSMRWFPWLYSFYDFHKGEEVLELGCGNGQLWKENKDDYVDISLILSDISQGMLEDAEMNLKDIKNIQYQCFDCHHIPFPDQSFDKVIANHVLFYLQDVSIVLKEIKRVLKPDGIFYCSTYGKQHMKEITDFIKGFDPKINLSHIQLYDIFGLENGQKILHEYFSNIELKKHEDYLLVDDMDDIINYILSCHGNQTEYILKDYKSFQIYMNRKKHKQMRITKDAGVFICRK